MLEDIINKGMQTINTSMDFPVPPAAPNNRRQVIKAAWLVVFIFSMVMLVVSGLTTINVFSEANYLNGTLGYPANVSKMAAQSAGSVFTGWNYANLNRSASALAPKLLNIYRLHGIDCNVLFCSFRYKTSNSTLNLTIP